ncbi:MAG: signal peptidase II [Anaerolineales bacterium]|nr:signal peptidase II [Anaerolineales bacterium]
MIEQTHTDENGQEKEAPAKMETLEDKKSFGYYAKDYLFLVLIAGTIILLDQWTKGIVENNLAISESWMPVEWLAPYVRIVHWWNTGSAFGMFQSAGPILTGLAVVVGAIIVLYFPQVSWQDWPLKVAMSLQLGGAMGNLIDRLTIGHVTDFISVGTFPVFNIADSSISIGVAVLVIGVWISEQREKKEAAEQALAARLDNVIDETELDAERDALDE